MAGSPGSGNFEAKVLMAKGKRATAAYIHADCFKSPWPKHLNAVLDNLLNPTTKSIDDWETIDWCKWLMAGGETPDEFASKVRGYDNPTTCGLVWTPNFVAYRCRTCGISPCMSLCTDCFKQGHHERHDFNMFLSQAGGACDCGDTSVMKEQGFCARHGPDKHAAGKGNQAPKQLMCVAEAMMPRIIFRLILHLRENSAISKDGQKLSILDADRFITMLVDFNNMGGLMRHTMTSALTNPQKYRLLNEIPDDADRDYAAFLTESRRIYEETLNSLPNPEPLTEFKNCPSLAENLVHKTFLEELVFWTVIYEFPQKVVCLLLNMLPDPDYKEALTRAFVLHYSRISMMLERSHDPDTLSNRVVHVSVQLFSNERLALRMTDQLNLLHVMVMSLRHMMHKILKKNTIHDAERGHHRVVDCARPVMKEHCYWPLVSDLNNVLSHRPVAFKFLGDDMLVEMWFQFLGMFQGMNVNTREMHQHVEFEPNTYYAAFSAELEASAYPMWALVSHLTDESSKHLSIKVLNQCLKEIQNWLQDIHFYGFNYDDHLQVSFHLPLYRYFSVFLCQAVAKQNLQLDEVLPNRNVLMWMMMHPLRIQVAFYEILNGLWVRNGLQIKGQAMTYIQCNFCNSMVDADLYLLQVISTRIPQNDLMNCVIDKFHVKEWMCLSPYRIPQNPFLEPEHDTAMLESFLTYLTTLISVRTNIGLSDTDLNRLEMVTLLCMGDKTHSQLMELMPERCGTSQSRDFETLLAEVADYRPPTLEASGTLQQGMYSPKPHVWEHLYSPIHVLLRAVHRRDFQTSMDRYTDYLRHANKLKSGSLNQPWPPFREPTPCAPAYRDPRCILHSRTFHAVAFVILYKAVKGLVSEHMMALIIFLLDQAVTVSASSGAAASASAASTGGETKDDRRNADEEEQCGGAACEDSRMCPSITGAGNYPGTSHKQRHDMELDGWFDSDDIFENLKETIPKITVDPESQVSPLTLSSSDSDLEWEDQDNDDTEMTAGDEDLDEDGGPSFNNSPNNILMLADASTTANATANNTLGGEAHGTGATTTTTNTDNREMVVFVPNNNTHQQQQQQQQNDFDENNQQIVIRENNDDSDDDSLDDDDDSDDDGDDDSENGAGDLVILPTAEGAQGAADNNLLALPPIPGQEAQTQQRYQHHHPNQQQQQQQPMDVQAVEAQVSNLTRALITAAEAYVGNPIRIVATRGGAGGGAAAANGAAPPPATLQRPMAVAAPPNNNTTTTVAMVGNNTAAVVAGTTAANQQQPPLPIIQGRVLTTLAAAGRARAIQLQQRQRERYNAGLVPMPGTSHSQRTKPYHHHHYGNGRRGNRHHTSGGENSGGGGGAGGSGANSAAQNPLLNVHINESLLSLLLQLHSHLSGMPDSFNPEEGEKTRPKQGQQPQEQQKQEQEQQENNVDSQQPQTGSSSADCDSQPNEFIGDGPFFVGKLLRKIARSSPECKAAIQRIRLSLWPSQKEQDEAKKQKENREREERRKRAKERQEKLMAEFASKQKQFMEQAMETDDVNMNSDDDDQEILVSKQEYDCVICSQSTPSTEDKPMGLVVLVQATSVIGHRRKFRNGGGNNDDNGGSNACAAAGTTDGAAVLPTCDQDRLFLRRDDTLAAEYDRRLEELDRHFDPKSWYLSVNLGWDGGVHVQTCGHHIHLDCLNSYLLALRSQQRSVNVSPEKGEYLCPLCRQLANSVLPLAPQLGDCAQMVRSKPLTNMAELLDEISEFLRENDQKPSNTNMAEAIGKIMEVMTSSTQLKPMFKPKSDTPIPQSLILFVTSIARTNLEVELIQRGGSLVTNVQEPPNPLLPKRDCIVPLLHVLSVHVRVARVLAMWPAWTTFQQLCGLPLKPPMDNLALASIEREVPLLLKDPVALLLQFVLLLPLHLDQTYFTATVQMVYNLLYYQAVVQISCGLTNQERQRIAAVSGDETEVATLTDALGLIQRHLGHTDLYMEDDDVDDGGEGGTAESTANSSIGESGTNDGTSTAAAATNSSTTTTSNNADRSASPMVTDVNIFALEQQVQKLCLPFLRIASLLKYHIYQQALPEIRDSSNEFVRLVYYLELINDSNFTTISSDYRHQPHHSRGRTVDWNNFNAASALNWPPQKYTGATAPAHSSHSADVSFGGNSEEVRPTGASSSTCSNITGGGPSCSQQMFKASPRAWCQQFAVFVGKSQIAARSMIVDQHVTWHPPRLLQLPREYEKIFTYYHERPCTQCQSVPQETSVCLLCGTVVCLKQTCCKQQNVCEATAHAQECGAGTGIFLVVTSTYIVVIRGHRACLWGSLYLDEFEEEDRDLKRGKPLYLSKDRYKLLEQQWLAHRFDHTKKSWVAHRNAL